MQKYANESIALFVSSNKRTQKWSIKENIIEKEWIEILQNENITTKNSFNILKTVYEFEDQQGYASEIGLKLGFKGKSPQSPINLEIGRFGKRIAKYYDIDLTIRENQKYKFWDLFS